MSKENGGPAFLGRTAFNANNMTYTFKDGSGAVPVEMRNEVLAACDTKNTMGANAAYVLGTLFSWKDRLAERSKP